MSPDLPDFTIESPVQTRIWYEGKRIAEVDVISVECDGDTIELLTAEDEELTFDEDEWDDLTIQYDP